MRKLVPLLTGLVGVQWGKKKEADHMTNFMLKMNDYFPFEVRRCIATKDFRYMQNFNYKAEGAV